MRIPMILAIVLLAAMALATAQNPTSESTQLNTPPTSTLTGCLKGSVNQYYVVEKNGTTHVLLARGHNLSPYVNHMVTLTGQADNNRDASASSDEGTARGNRFFAVDSVDDQGACKK